MLLEVLVAVFKLLVILLSLADKVVVMADCIGDQPSPLVVEELNKLLGLEIGDDEFNDDDETICEFKAPPDDDETGHGQELSAFSLGNPNNENSDD